MIRNWGASLLALALTPLASYALILLLAIQLGPGAVGVFAAFTVTLYLLQSLGSLGLDTYLVRHVAALPERRAALLGGALSLAAAGGLVGAVVAVLLPGVLVEGTEGQHALQAGSLAVIPAACAVIAEGYLNGIERNSLVAASNCAESLLRMAAALVAIRAGAGVLGAVLAVVAGRWFGLAIDLWLIHRVSDVLPAWQGPRRLARQARSAVGFSLNYVVLLTLQRGDLLWLTRLVGEVSFGVFYGGYRVFEMAVMVPQGLLPALLSAASRLWHEASPTAARDATERAGRVLLAVLLVPTALLGVHAHWVLGLLFPPEFQQAAAPTSILGLSLVSFGLATVAGAYLYAAGRPALVTAVLVPAAAAAVALNLLLVPRLGGTGTALARVAWTWADALGLFAASALLPVRLRLLPILLRPLLAAAPAFAVLVLLRGLPPVSIAAALLVDVAGLWALGVLHRDVPELARAGRRRTMAEPVA
jgi:O-antigen/teichoic acid export membrane protein